MEIKQIKSSRWTYISAVIVANLIMWAIPSNLDKLIAKGRPVMMGCYSVEKLTCLFVMAILTLSVIYALLPREAKKRKFRFFQIIAVFMFLVPSILVLDIGIRLVRQARYVKTDEVYHRPPGQKKDMEVDDIPKGESGFYRNVPVYESYKCTLTTDSNGFRNKTVPEVADVVTIGDSFTEGTDVGDDDIWPVLMAAKGNKTLYNIGMSGTDPLDYFLTFQKYGVGKKPKTVICMLYEGNDFRSDGRPEDRLRNVKEGTLSFSKQLRAWKNSSPVISAVRGKLEQWFETKPEHLVKRKNNNVKSSNIKVINKENAVDEGDLLKERTVDFSDWLPTAVPGTKATRYYFFPPKRMMSFYYDKAEFEKSELWANVRFPLDKIVKICKDNNCKLIIVYAPTKPKVILPLIKEITSAEQLHYYASLKESVEEPEEFKKRFFKNIDTINTVVKKYCADQNIGFVDLTEPLRQEVGKGEQVYFSFDQHWSPLGHKIVADIISNYLKVNNY